GERRLRVRNDEVVEFPRLVEAFEMRVEAEDGGAVSGRVRLHALEDARAVLEPVCEDVHFRVVPRHQPAVEPDRVGRRESHMCLPATIYRNPATWPIRERTCPNFVSKNAVPKRPSR